MLNKSDIIDKVYQVLKKKESLFDSFEEVYLFGSLLDTKRISNDVDILLIYSIYSSKILMDKGEISSVLEYEIGMPIDITILSIEEDKETGFSNKIKNMCLKLK